MDVREKLVELLQHDNCPLFMVFGDKVDVLADYLIANGVTVQKWISVKDRLPNIDEMCLLSVESRITRYRWVAIGFYHTDHDECITHWMPLPPAPKGE